MLEDTSRYLATGQDIVSIIKAYPLKRRPTNANSRPIGTVTRQGFNRGNGILVKGGLHHKILGIVSRNKHLGQRHKVRPALFASLPSASRLCRVALDIPHCRVQLRQCQTKAIRHARTPGIAF